MYYWNYVVCKKEQATTDDFLNLNTCRTSIRVSLKFILCIFTVYLSMHRECLPSATAPPIVQPFILLCPRSRVVWTALLSSAVPPSSITLTKLSKHLAVFPVSWLDEWYPMHENFNGSNMSDCAAFLIGRIKLMNKSKRLWNNPDVP